VRTQIETVISDIGVDAAKTGMLHTNEIIDVVSEEAETLSGLKVRTLDEAKAAAKKTADLGPRAVVVKGGHSLLYNGFIKGCLKNVSDLTAQS